MTSFSALRTRRSVQFTTFAAALLIGNSLVAAPAQAQNATALKAQHEQVADKLGQSPFGRPLLLNSSPTAKQPQGEVHAIVQHPFAAVAAALQKPEHWCDVLMLQSNVKRCVPSGNALQMFVGRKFDQPVEDAFRVDFNYAVRAANADYLSVQMTADAGPLGTSDYRLSLEAVPIDAKRTFVHMRYSYAAGLGARMATDAYLATTGRDKVGFSVVGKDDAGKPQYVDGIRGIAERNTMRYYLAIEAFLDTLALPADQRAEKRMQQWFAATEKYPRQLKEMERDQYLVMKRREIADAGSAARRG